MKKIVVTGATGFIGKHCLPLLEEKGYEIHAFSTKIQSDYGDNNINWHKFDLLNPNKLKEILKAIKPTHLLHLAWYVVPGKCYSSIENYRWVQASLDLLFAFSQSGGQRAVMAGSCAEYDGRYSYFTEGLTPLKPNSIYGTCKHALQEMFGTFIETVGISGAWARIFFLYGPHEHPARLVPSVIQSLLANKPARCSHGNQLRDYLYVQDVADAFVRIIESDVQGSINIASGYPVSLKDIVYRIAEKLDQKNLVRLGALPVPPDEPDLIVGNAKRLSNELGWKPKYSLDDGLNKTISWWRQPENKGSFK